MSDNIIRLIPTNPSFVPDLKSHDRAIRILRTMVKEADSVSVEVTDEVQFIDQGSNFERVTCPSCGSEITDLWTEMMDNAYSNGFSDLNIELSCCGLKTDLNALKYEWPAGFARFVLEAVNPHVDGWLPKSDIEVLEKALSCTLRQIFTHV